MYNYYMPRPELDNETKERGRKLGKVISAERSKQNLSQEQLAIKANVRIETLKSIELGRVFTPNAFTISAIAKALKGDLNKWLK